MYKRKLDESISHSIFNELNRPEKREFQSPQARNLSAVNRFKLTRLLKNRGDSHSYQVSQYNKKNGMGTPMSSSRSVRARSPKKIIRDFVSQEDEDISMNLSFIESKKQRASARKLSYSHQLSDNARRFSNRATSVCSNKSERDN